MAVIGVIITWFGETQPWAEITYRGALYAVDISLMAASFTLCCLGIAIYQCFIMGAP